jgi:hypothetical protein
MMKEMLFIIPESFYFIVAAFRLHPCFPFRAFPFPCGTVA